MDNSNVQQATGGHNTLSLLAKIVASQRGELDHEALARETAELRRAQDLDAERAQAAEVEAWRLTRFLEKMDQEYELERAQRETARRERIGVGVGEILHRGPAQSDERRWIWRGLVARGVPQLLLGPPKAGKSWLMLELAMLAAAGRGFCGIPNTLGRPARVLVLSMEDGSDEVGDRLWRLARAHDIDPRSLDSHLRIECENHVYLSDEIGVARLRRALREYRPDVIFIDSFARVHQGGENQVEQTKPSTVALQELSREFNTAIVVIHHESRTAKGPLWERARGSGDLGAMARWIVSLRPAGKSPGRVGIETAGNVGGGAAALSMILDLAHGDGTRYERRDEGRAGENDMGVERSIVDYLRLNPRATKTTVVETAGLGRAQSVRQAWERLVARGEIVSEGRGRRAVWRVTAGPEMAS